MPAPKAQPFFLASAGCQLPAASCFRHVPVACVAVCQLHADLMRLELAERHVRPGRLFFCRAQSQDRLSIEEVFNFGWFHGDGRGPSLEFATASGSILRKGWRECVSFGHLEIGSSVHLEAGSFVHLMFVNSFRGYMVLGGFDASRLSH